MVFSLRTRAATVAFAFQWSRNNVVTYTRLDNITTVIHILIVHTSSTAFRVLNWISKFLYNFSIIYNVGFIYMHIANMCIYDSGTTIHNIRHGTVGPEDFPISAMYPVYTTSAIYNIFFDPLELTVLYISSGIYNNSFLIKAEKIIFNTWTKLFD